MESRFLLFYGDCSVGINTRPLPVLQEGEVLIKSHFSAISSGSEMLAYRGELPPDLALDATIAVLQQPVRYPLQYGYALTGMVAEAAGSQAAIWLGRRVFAFHPHSSHAIVSAADLQGLPDELSWEQATLFPNMETAVSLLQDAAPLIGEDVLVSGGGIVGQLLLRLLAQLPLRSCVLLEPLAARRRLAEAVGGVVALDPGDAQVEAKLAAVQPEGADLAFEVSGNPPALNTLISHTRFDGRIVVGAWYGTKPASLDLGGRFHRGRIRLISSQVSSINPQLSGRWSRERRRAEAWRQLCILDSRDLIDHKVPFSEAVRAYQEIDKRPENSLQVLLDYTAGE